MKEPLELLAPPYPGPKRWKHQQRVFKRSCDEPYWGLFLEQRTGKTPILIDTVTYLYRSGKIDAFIYFAPNGVHADLVTDYLPVYLGRDIPTATHVWRSVKADYQGPKLEREMLLKFPGLSILAINTEALITKAVRKYLPKFMKARHTLVAIDESIDISSPKAARTKVAIRIGLLADYRRILDGTPLDAGPLGAWSQCEFLRQGALGFSPSISLGRFVLAGYYSFRERYAELETDFIERDGKTVAFKKINGDDDGKKIFKNLD